MTVKSESGELNLVSKVTGSCFVCVSLALLSADGIDVHIYNRKLL